MLAYFRGEPGWFDQLVSQHGVQVAMAQPGGALDRYLRARASQPGGWQLIAQTPSGALFRRGSAP